MMFSIHRACRPIIFLNNQRVFDGDRRHLQFELGMRRIGNEIGPGIEGLQAMPATHHTLMCL
jgi:hypothetical protein